jgi:hypothetical protein
MKTPSHDIATDRTRRQILGWGGAGLAVGVAGYFSIPSSEEPVGNAAATSAKPTAPTKLPPLPPIAHVQFYSRDAFLPQLKTEFTINHNADARATCQLIDISPAAVMTTGKGDFISFTLLFAAHQNFLKTGGICQVTHPQLAEMEFFLTPVGNDKKQHLLEACFTQRV